MLVVRSYVCTKVIGRIFFRWWNELTQKKKPRPSGKCKRITKSSSNSFLASWFYCYTNICTFDSAQKYNKKKRPTTEFWTTNRILGFLLFTGEIVGYHVSYVQYIQFRVFFAWNIHKIAPLESTKWRNKCSQFIQFFSFTKLDFSYLTHLKTFKSVYFKNGS